MKHTPYGYDIVGGKAVVNEEQADIIRNICKNYLSGMSMIAAAKEAGVTMTHSRVKHLLQNKRYLGIQYRNQQGKVQINHNWFLGYR